MSHRISRRFQVLAALGCSLLAAVPALAAIEVEVNGEAVRFGAVQPVRSNGRVLIPLRAVVESLGAQVRWDPATQTVRGNKADHAFELRINSRDATVDEKPYSLDVPAQITAGSTMVPLRFVAEALGADVEWNAAAQRVVINDTGGAPDRPAGDRVSGTVVAVRPDATPPTITVRAGGLRQSYELGQDAIILRSARGRRAVRVDLNAIQPGDEVKLRVNADRGIAEIVEATAPQAQPGGAADNAPEEIGITGEVVTLRVQNDVRRVTIRTSTGRVTYEVPDAVTVTRRGARRSTEAAFEDIQVGDQVRVVPEREGGRVLRSIEITTPRTRTRDRDALPQDRDPDPRDRN